MVASQRAIAVLVSAVLIGAVELASTCPRGNCAVTRSMSCCEHEGLTKPCCCPAFKQGPPSGSRATVRFADHTSYVALPSQCASISHRAKRYASPPIARAFPDRTLLSQYTSLIL
jgi:hypothetical protein